MPLDGNRPATISRAEPRSSDQPRSGGALAGLQRALFRNSATMALSRVLSAAVGLLMVPLIVARIGVDGFGVWEAILAVATLAGLFQNAIAGTLLWRAAGEHAAGHAAGVSRTLRLGLGFIVLELFVFVPPMVFLRREMLAALNVPMAYSDSAALVLPATVAVTILGGVNECIGAVVTGCQRSGSVAIAQTVAQAVNYGVVIACLFGGLGLASMLLGLLAAALVTFAILLLVARRLMNRLVLVPAVPTRPEVRLMWPYMRNMMVGSIAIAVRGQLTKLVTASAASPTWTGYYGIANRLASTILIMLSFFSYPAVSAFAALRAKGTSADVDALYLRLLRVVSMASGAVAVVVASGYDRILVAWLGRYIPEVAPMLILLVVTNVLVTIMTGIGSALCKGVGKPEIETRYVVFGLVLNLVLLPLLTSRWGAMGAVIAGAVSYVLSGFYFVFAMRGELGPGAAKNRVMAATAIGILVSSLGARLVGGLWPIGATRLGAILSFTAVSAVGVALFLAVASALRVFSWRNAVRAWRT